MIKISKNKILWHVVMFESLVGIEILKYEFWPFLQLLQKKIDTATDFAYDVGKIRSIYQNERLEKRSSISPGKGLPGEVFSESGNSKRVKSYFKKKNLE